jgi:hypothetical protein
MSSLNFLNIPMLERSTPFGFATFRSIGEGILDLEVPQSEFSIKYFRANSHNRKAFLTIPQRNPSLSRFHSSFTDITFGSFSITVNPTDKRIIFSPHAIGDRPSISLSLPKPRKFLFEQTLPFSAGPFHAELRTLQTAKSTQTFCRLSVRYPFITSQVMFPSPITGSIEINRPGLSFFASAKPGAITARLEAQGPTDPKPVRIFAEAELSAMELARAVIGFCIQIAPIDLGLSYDHLERRLTAKVALSEGMVRPALAVMKGELGGSMTLGVKAAAAGHGVAIKFDSSEGCLVGYDGEIDEFTVSVAIAAPAFNFKDPRVRFGFMTTG